MKRKLGHEPDEDIFNIFCYDLKTLDSLINMINDYDKKKLPPKRQRRYYPSKMDLLPDILSDLEELNKMTGLKKFKIQLLEQILFFIQDIDEKIMLHTVLEGPPGTGKTTVAGILSKIYAKIGIFKKVKFNVLKRSDLISEYLGGTTIKTTKALDRCKKGVVLIDEAYSIGSTSGEDIYAKECVDTINQYLTENYDKIVCIIAGYKQELDRCFFSINPGLRRRFPWTFTIDNYSSNELAEIFYKIVKEKEWETTCKESDIIDIINKKHNLFTGNGGDITSIVEKSMINNCRKNFGKEQKYTIELDDFIHAMNIFEDNKKGKLNNVPYGMYN
tara:strand:- start:3847 stop:4839 length:993 start_codon:yes stop_codon:yes gene_type:complete